VTLGELVVCGGDRALELDPLALEAVRAVGLSRCQSLLASALTPLADAIAFTRGRPLFRWTSGDATVLAKL